MTITLPDGTTADDDRALSDWLGRPVTLRAAAERGERVFENPADFEHDAVWEPFRGSTGAFHDSGKVQVSLLSRATIADWPRRRFRANIILDGGGEDALVGARVGLGGAELFIRQRITRCVMVTRPQPEGIDGPIDEEPRCSAHDPPRSRQLPGDRRHRRHPRLVRGRRRAAATLLTARS